MKIIFITVIIPLLLACTPSDSNQNSNGQTNINDETMTYPAKHISVSVHRPAADVYQFAANPENFPKWVAFVKSLTKQGDSWVGETTLGTIKIKFTPQNDFGIIDHQVTLPTGETVGNHMRVITNNNGCEFIFTLFRLPGRTDEEFKEDANAVTKDLQSLKAIMEKK
jgi:hypothetical protein